MTIVDRSALLLIGGYQKYISPHKGFVCAHRVLHGGSSCSQFFCESIIENGIYEAIKSLIQRGKACGRAAILLTEAQNEKDKSSFWTEEPTGKDMLYCCGYGISCCLLF